MQSRWVSIILATLAAIAGAIGASPRSAATPVAAECRTACCGGACQCGDACACAVDEAPAAPDDGSPALPERSRGERAPLVAVTAPATEPVSTAEAVDLGTRSALSTAIAAPPSCRLRLALVSRWTT